MIKVPLAEEKKNNYRGKFQTEKKITLNVTGLEKMVEKLIKSGADVNVVNHCSNSSALILAIEAGKSLILSGAQCSPILIDLNKNKYNRLTNARKLSFIGFLKIVEMLIDNGADLNAEDGSNDLALILAIRIGKTKNSQEYTFTFFCEKLSPIPSIKLHQRCKTSAESRKYTVLIWQLIILLSILAKLMLVQC